jgi:hypothetical protein
VPTTFGINDMKTILRSFYDVAEDLSTSCSYKRHMFPNNALGTKSPGWGQASPE